MSFADGFSRIWVARSRSARAAASLWRGSLASAVLSIAGWQRETKRLFLAPFPVSLLPLNVDMRRRLPMMGIRSIGDYAALSRAGVFEQWDKQGCWCYDLAIGVDSRPLQSCQPPPVITQRLSFEDAVADKEILLAACLQLAPALIHQLQGRAAGRLVLLLTDEHYHTHELHLRPSAPLRSPAHFHKQLPPLLEKPTYSTGILQLGLQLSELTTVQPQQLSLFEVSREQRSVIQAVNAWRQRFHETVYQLDLDRCAAALPAGAAI